MKRDQNTNVEPLAELQQEVSVVVIVLMFTEIISRAGTSGPAGPESLSEIWVTSCLHQ